MTGTPKSMLSPKSLTRQIGARSQRAFTLFEVMIATIVFTMGILGVYAMMIKSYEMVTISRHRDNGRAVLLTYVDQFLRLQIADGGVRRGIFVPHAATGMGLTWQDGHGSPPVDGNLYDAYPYMPVMLGDSGNSLLGSQVQAHVYREVTLIDATTGDSMPGTDPALTAAGYLLQGKFTIFYDISGRQQSQSITVLRSAR